MVTALQGSSSIKTKATLEVDLSSIAASHAATAAVLAGFSLTFITIFLASRLRQENPRQTNNIGQDGSDRGEETTLSMLFIAFIGCNATSIIYSMLTGKEKGFQVALSFNMASMVYYLSVVFLFGAFIPVLSSVGFQSSKFLARVIFIFGIVAGILIISATLSGIGELARGIYS